MQNKAWVIAVNMGYGHQRTAYPLRFLAVDQKVINANDYEGIPKNNKEIWDSIRQGYEFVSNFKRIPLIGQATFYMMDRVQRIWSFYPKRDLSKPNPQLKQTIATIKSGWGKELIERLGSRNKEMGTDLPLISTFFTAAFMAESFNYSGKIFCVVCDADISRTWAPLNPGESKIKYLAPTERVVERLKLYGVKPQNIYFTGFPLPLENIGTENMEILKEDLRYRLLNLDPEKRYFKKYRILIEANLGALPEKPDHPLTILFSVGGAGAQKEMAIKIFKNLMEKIRRGKIKMILSAGIRKDVKEYFEREIAKEMFSADSKGNIEILFGKDINDYFEKFNKALRKTDILWTKPSELSFYSALGVPIIVAPTIGSQEDFNMRWILKSGFGIFQEDSGYTEQWLFDWLSQGYLAEAAMQGFVEGEKLGAYKIRDIISR